MRKVDRLFGSLFAALAVPAHGSRRVFVTALHQWLLAHLAQWDTHTRFHSGLERAATWALEALPIEASLFDHQGDFGRFLRAPPASMAQLTVIVGDWLWEGVTVTASRHCNHCGNGPVKYLVDDDAALYLSCEGAGCGWSATVDRVRKTPSSFLRPAPAELISALPREVAS